MSLTATAAPLLERAAAHADEFAVNGLALVALAALIFIGARAPGVSEIATALGSMAAVVVGAIGALNLSTAAIGTVARTSNHQ